MTFTDFERDNDAESGIFWDHFVEALATWVYLNEEERKLSIAEAALVFNTTPALVREAVEEHPWLFLSGDVTDASKTVIASDGE